MKILQVYKDYYPPVKGGIECHINLLANGLKNRGNDVQVLVSNRYNRFEEEICNGIRIFKAPQLGRFYSAPITPTFYLYLRHLGKTADIIHFHHPNPTADFSYLFTNLSKSFVVTYHSDIIRQDKLGILYSPFRKVFLDMADSIIATSPNYIKTSNVLKQYEHKCTVIPLGIELKRFTTNHDSSKIERIKRKYENQSIILFVGCFRYYKGLHFLISSMEGIKAKLLLIGAGPEETRLRALVKRKKLHDKVHFLGELSDIAVNGYYKACDIFVLPSHLRSEAFGIVQLEAMCCKKPVINTELGTGTTFVNIHQETGITVKPNDIESLSAAINYLIDHPEKRIHFGECGYKRVKDLFSADRMVDSTLQLYEEVLKKDCKVGYKKNIERKVSREKIKILRIISRMNIGGPSIHVKNLTENLNSEKFCTRLITGSVSPGEGDMGYITHFEDNVKIFIPELQREISIHRDLTALLKIIKIIYLFDPDIVHSHTSKAGTLSRSAVLICNRFRKKKIIAVHTFHGHVLEGYFSNLKSILFRLIERLLAKDTDRIIAIGDSQKWELVNLYKIDTPNKIDVIKLGFDLTPFLDGSNQKGVLRKQLGLSTNSVLVGIVGRMAPIKNHKMFLDSAQLLIASAAQKDIKFILVGDGEQRSLLEKYAADSGLSGHVIFHGWEKNIPIIYADLDILALTSLNEGTPVSVIEAMAASVPVVTTGVGGIKDLLGRFEADQPHQVKFKVCERGILCPKADPITFANAMNYMLESGYLLDERRFTSARDYVVENYSMDRLVNEIEDLYQRLIA